MSQTSQRTDTDIANFALDLLKSPPMTDIENPNGHVERRVARVFPDARDLVLKKHWWTPARATVSLPALSETDAEYGGLFQLPDDCLLVWTVAGAEDGFVRRAGQGAGRIAYNGAAPVSVVYGRRITAGETPVEIALLIGAQAADMIKSAAGVELTKADRQTIEDALHDREIEAMRICGTEGGIKEQFRSRFVDAAYGYDPYRPIWDQR